MPVAIHAALLQSVPVIGIMRNFPRRHIATVMERYVEAGLTAIEITLNSDPASEIIGELRKAYPDTLHVGAGTVRTKEGLRQAIDAGAQFIVTPALNEAVLESAVETGIPVFPGALTPSEIERAWTLGATAVKVFPAARLGAPYIKDILEPLNDIKLIPTGGISADNMEEYFAAGAFGVGMGSGLFPKQFIDNADWDGLSRYFGRVVKIAAASKDKNNKI